MLFQLCVDTIKKRKRCFYLRTFKGEHATTILPIRLDDGGKLSFSAAIRWENWRKTLTKSINNFPSGCRSSAYHHHRIRTHYSIDLSLSLAVFGSLPEWETWIVRHRFGCDWLPIWNTCNVGFNVLVLFTYFEHRDRVVGCSTSFWIISLSCLCCVVDYLW